MVVASGKHIVGRFHAVIRLWHPFRSTPARQGVTKQKIVPFFTAPVDVQKGSKSPCSCISGMHGILGTVPLGRLDLGRENVGGVWPGRNG